MSDRPNILLILADDLGYGDVGCYGARAEHVRTPHIDSLAREGVRFTDAHSPSSVCSPSRYNLLTGRYCWRTWAKTGCIWANDPCVIEEDRPTIASVLREGGYETAMVGKWHLGFGAADDEHWDPVRGPDFNRPITHGPLTCGFDHFFGIPAVGQLPHVFIHDNMVCDLESGDPMRLVHPCEDLREAYMDMVADFRTQDDHWPHGANENCNLAMEDFAAYCELMRDHRHGRNLPEGWVPGSMFWCMAGERMMGTLSLRHELNDMLRGAGGHIGYAMRPSERNKGYMTRFLRLGLQEARKVGLDRVLITCADSNLASARVIEKCGGVLEDKRATQLHGDDLTRRYWIELPG